LGQGSINKLFLPFLVRSIKQELLESDAQAERGFIILQIFILDPDVNIVNGHLQVVNNLGGE
jgi:hypothetical protein